MELLKIKTEQFEGPLDLMLFLIQKHELDISAISIHKITDQYVFYVEMMRELNIDLASEFLVMAATLIHLKSKKLLPQDDLITTQASDGENITSEEDLIRRLKEYQKFQEIGQTLRTQPILHQDVFPKPNVSPPEKQTIWKELDLTELTLVFQDLLKKSRHSTKIVIREPVSIPERISALSKILKLNEMTEFASVLSEEPTRSEIVVTFISLLELARLKKIKIFQNEIFGSVYIMLTTDLNEFDPTLVTGFQYKVKDAIANA